MSKRHSILTASPYERQFGFCRALRVDNHIVVAGTAPIGDDGKTVGIGDAEAQARRCFDIIGRSLEKLDANWSNVVRTRMFLKRIEDWESVSRVHGEFFRQVNPVATIVSVSGFLDPDWLVEIEADAIVHDDD